MAELLRNLAIVLVFAWLARSLLGARELTWRRTILATLCGLLLGAIGAAALLVRDLDHFDAFETIRTEFYALTLGLAVPATMAVMVFFELMFTSRGSHRRFRPFRTLKRWFRMWIRGLQVTRIAAHHGLAPLLGLRRGEASARTPSEIARRTRMSLEEAGGMFVKLGQLLVTRPDLLPSDALAELSLLHAEVSPLPEAVVKALILEETDRPVDEVFSVIKWEPLGSASIGQAHAARLLDGREVVLKVRRPGLEEQVDTDLAIVRWLANVAERRTSWGKAYNVNGLALEFSTVLRAELRFGVEAKYAMEMGAACADDPLIRVPAIVESLTTDRMLVMERMFGTPMSKPDGVGAVEPDQRRALADALCRSQVSAMLHGQRFHGDPHPGNVLMLDDGSLGLVDFGITGRLDTYERAAVYEVLLAMRLEQPALLYDALMTVGAIRAEHDPDQVERELAQFLTSLTGPGFPGTEALTDLLRLTTRLGMTLPPSTTTMFRALATLAGTLETLSPRYPIFEIVADIGGAEMKERMQPASAGEFVLQEWAEFGPLLRRAPRHLDRVARLAENGQLTGRVRLFAFPDDVRTVERLLNRFLLTLLTIGLGGVSVALLTSEGGPDVAGIEVRIFEVLGWATAAFATLLLLRVLLGVLRSERTSESS
ncbi:MAG: AarF/UbiB family protein [Acidimicrobiia bacterium]|jgi:ubiquinone biosynthesis protein